MATVLLMGLDGIVARRIESVLTRAGFEVLREPFRTHFPVCPQADVLFLWGDHRDYAKALAAIRAHRDAPPVVVTTMLPDGSEWIEANEEGVAGYCVAPFNAPHILWTLGEALNRKKAKGGRTMAA